MSCSASIYIVLSATPLWKQLQYSQALGLLNRRYTYIYYDFWHDWKKQKKKPKILKKISHRRILWKGVILITFKYNFTF